MSRIYAALIFSFQIAVDSRTIPEIVQSAVAADTFRVATPVQTYLTELRDIRSSGAGVKETSYYVPLANLLNEIGNSLKPKVRAILQLQNSGVGLPDGGFFTPDQLKNKDRR